MPFKDPSHLYKRVSLELSHSWPGEVYLRFEPFGYGPTIMVRVMPGDIVSLAELVEHREVVLPDRVEPEPYNLGETFPNVPFTIIRS